MNPLYKKLSLTSLLLFTLSLSGCFTQSAPRVTFTTIQGQTLAPKDYLGKVVLVSFWATSCTTCVKEMPKVVDTFNKYKAQDFKTIAVAMSYDRPDYVVNFAQTRHLPFDVALDVDGKIAKTYNNVSITPTSYLLNRKGEIIKTYVGEPDFDALHKLIEQSLAQGA
jgi:peroxiredoxin